MKPNIEKSQIAPMTSRTDIYILIYIYNIIRENGIDICVLIQKDAPN